MKAGSNKALQAPALDPSMKKISSGTTAHKWLVPLFWLVFLAIVLKAAAGKDLMLLLAPVLVGIMGFLNVRRVWALADDVYDCGSFLLVKSRGKEERIELSAVMSVSPTKPRNHPLITLSLTRPRLDGTSELTFFSRAAFTFNPFAKNEIAEDLIVRVNRARRGV